MGRPRGDSARTLRIQFHVAAQMMRRYWRGDFAVQAIFALTAWLIGGIMLALPTRDLSRFDFHLDLHLDSALHRSGLTALVTVPHEPATA